MSLQTTKAITVSYSIHIACVLYFPVKKVLLNEPHDCKRMYVKVCSRVDRIAEWTDLNVGTCQKRTPFETQKMLLIFISSDYFSPLSAIKD